MTAINLRPRRPLESLPLSQYTSLAVPPSPISLSHKRSFTSSPNRAGESSSSKARKVSDDHGGVETIRRKRSDLAPEAKAALSMDEFGIGKSPARRLFVDDGTSGATIATPPTPSSGGPSRRLDFSTTPTNSPGPSRGLAPSPPISSAPSPSEHENGATVDIHDIGFIIHADPASGSASGSETSGSRPHQTRNLNSADASSHIPSAPSSSTDVDDNEQENIPPPQRTPSRSSRGSTVGSPLSKSSVSGSSTSARFFDDTSIVALTGSGRNRIREKSKLNKVYKSAAVDKDSSDVEDELTPGRTRPTDKGKGKQKLASEVNCL